ncbi:monocarboxylate transporter 6 [Nematolebias whitei]|uniref:monocarboxylate transporter 6 n=1 Tax=Nematolebias whitei TaxID=451745 RepID=UPI001898E42F|nr:monocarboxylate transporter 6 [Nematolebias whitei]
MTQQNGIGASTDHRVHSEASKALESANGVEFDEVQEVTETEEGGKGGESQDPVVVAGAAAAPDGGWGWVVLASTILVLSLTLGLPASMGIFFTDLQNEFLASNSETSWVTSIMTSALHAGGPISSVLIHKLGCRETVILGGVLSGVGMAVSSFTRSITELYITAGVITGLGFCFSVQPGVTILGHYFVRHRAFANAMSSTGTALGLCILPVLGNYLHTEYGWRGSFLILGAILLNLCVCGAVMRPLEPKRHRGQPLINHKPPPSDQENEMKQNRTVWKYVAASLRKHMAFDQFCHNRRYRVYAIGITWMMLGFVVPLVYLVPFATSNDMEPRQAALLLSILGIINIIVRPPFGIVFNMAWFKGRHIYVFSAALLVNGLSNIICCIGASFPVLVIYVTTYGLSMSVVGSLMFTVLMDIVEMSHFPSALGLLAVMESVTLLTGPPLAGILVDRTGQYFYVFIACSAVVASSAIFLMSAFLWLDKTEEKASKRGQPPAQPDLKRPATNASPGCRYRSVPTDGDRDKAAPHRSEYMTSV